MSAWVLPDHIADVLPSEARHIEELRRTLLDTARSYGYELVIPPLIEHLESLLSGTGEGLDLKTFKLIDQASGRTLGLRADITPQVARIDAHLLNRKGVTRLCYAGSVAHTHVAHAHATREPLQFGAEIFGHEAIEADLESIDLIQTCLKACGLQSLILDLSDVRVVEALFELQGQVSTGLRHQVLEALSVKDVPRLQALTQTFKPEVSQSLLALPGLYGDAQVLTRAQALLPSTTLMQAAFADLTRLAQAAGSSVQVTVDLSDMRGHAYYTATRFSVYATEAQRGSPIELARGGRYDEVGAAFGRRRPAVGFGLDIKDLVRCLAPAGMRPVIRAPWKDDDSLQAAIRSLRSRGEGVVCVLPGHEQEVSEFDCDRELIQVNDMWLVQSLT